MAARHLLSSLPCVLSFWNPGCRNSHYLVQSDGGVERLQELEENDKSLKSSRCGLYHHICSHSIGKSMSCGPASFQQAKNVYFSNRRHCKPHGRGRELKFFSQGRSWYKYMRKRLQSIIDCHYVVTSTIGIQTWVWHDANILSKQSK